MLDNILFQNLFDDYYTELCKIVYPVVNNTTDAEDLVQDVFVKLWVNRGKNIIKTNYKAYLYKACIFKAIDVTRKRKTKLEVDKQLKAKPVQNSNIEDELNASELQNIISQSLAKLSESTQEIFLLSRYSQLKNKEIAEQLGISIKTVEANISKALKKLREDLKPYFNVFIIAVILTQELFEHIYIG